DGNGYDFQFEQQLHQQYPFLDTFAPPPMLPDAGGITDLSMDYADVALLTYSSATGIGALKDTVSGLFAADGTGARLALSAPRQVDFSWGALNTYREGGQMSAIEHINYRHAFDSGFSDVSRYAEGTSARDIQGFVNQASRYGNVTPQGANSFKIEYNFGQTIGTGQAGEAASGIRVFIRNEQVQTAFPISFP
ncbi:MAG: hypothetical protein WCS42_19440, partial [Verrucomicrobiota bacterium]